MFNLYACQLVVKLLLFLFSLFLITSNKVLNSPIIGSFNFIWEKTSWNLSTTFMITKTFTTKTFLFTWITTITINLIFFYFTLNHLIHLYITNSLNSSSLDGELKQNMQEFMIILRFLWSWYLSSFINCYKWPYISYCNLKRYLHWKQRSVRIVRLLLSYSLEILHYQWLYCIELSLKLERHWAGEFSFSRKMGSSFLYWHAFFPKVYLDLLFQIKNLIRKYLVSEKYLWQTNTSYPFWWSCLLV